jgi:hypothetical protein
LQVRDNAIVVFVAGVILDHTFDCFASIGGDRHDRSCTRLAFVRPWVQTGLQVHCTSVPLLLKL